MALTVNLSPEQEAELKREAAANGLRVEDYVVRQLLGGNGRSSQEPNIPKTPAETVAYWEREGLFGAFSWGPDGPELASELRREAESREW